MVVVTRLHAIRVPIYGGKKEENEERHMIGGPNNFFY